MRLVVDITVTSDDRYHGHVAVAGTDTRQEFSGVLEFLAILERLLLPGGGTPDSSPGKS
jgi:hypothetical protein